MSKKKSATVKKTPRKRSEATRNRSTVGDWIKSSDGGKVSLVAKAMVAESSKSTLADVQAELESGLATIQELVGDVGGMALITSPYEPH